MTLKKEALENTVGKGENAVNQHFFLFPECFLQYQRENHHNSNNNLSSANAFSLE